jgi:hypothetical protein
MIAAALALLRMMAKLAAAGLAAVALGLFLVSLVYAAEPVGSGDLPQAETAQQKETRAEAKSAMTRCLETWDPATQMSKQEWKETCERTTKENPNLYDKPY